jgi:hypothetical protein
MFLNFKKYSVILYKGANLRIMTGGGKRKALVIGISDYASLQSLDFCKKDGQEIYEILSSLGYEVSEN